MYYNLLVIHICILIMFFFFHVMSPLYAADLKKFCKAIVEARNDEERMKAFTPIQEIITLVQFANDECDYGMAYEFGIDLFCYGSHVSLSLLMLPFSTQIPWWL